MNSFLKNNLSNSNARILKQVFLRLRGLFYYGNKYYCNICNRSFRKFLDGGFDLQVIKDMEIIGAGRRTHICPNCQSTDRDRLIKTFFDSNVNLSNSKIKMLHIAPEPSLNNYLKKLPNIDYITAAKYHEGIYYPEDMVLVDLTDMHFSDSEFDFIICNHVLEHIDNDKLALSEIYRVLRKGGTAILQVPFSNKLSETYENPDIKTVKEREEHFGQFDHVRLYGKDYPNILSKAGFILNIYEAENIIDKTEIERLSIFKNEPLFVVTK